MTHISQKSKLRECVATHFLSGDNRTQPSSLDLQLQTELFRRSKDSCEMSQQDIELLYLRFGSGP
ncbi:Hypothetical protein SMAX5B_016803 [Scophthalmus maximus]|uniref:Uncharacterized protein n=1 Tax=Scophthalmus maximus TaxID=52904 RepID=A0A2U9CDN9_SCOMX|nr:Hypothetical protein SMAX5B_016803 [Scophthalmus maximus]